MFVLSRFHVIVDMIKPEKLDNTTALKGLDYLDVPASSKKDHKLTFFSYKEGLYSAKVDRHQAPGPQSGAVACWIHVCVLLCLACF